MEFQDKGVKEKYLAYILGPAYQQSQLEIYAFLRKGGRVVSCCSIVFFHDFYSGSFGKGFGKGRW